MLPRLSIESGTVACLQYKLVAVFSYRTGIACLALPEWEDRLMQIFLFQRAVLSRY